jgi:hypothetical protein
MRKITMGLVVCMVFIVTVGIAAATEKEQAAKSEKLIGYIINHDAQAGTITIEADKNGSKGHVMKIDPALIKEISVGDVVEYEKSGNTVKSLKKIMPPTDESF